VIPEAAVEAAAKAIYEDGWLGPPFWESLGDDNPAKVRVISATRLALEAAAPHMNSRAVEYLDESVRRISSDPEVGDYERGFDDSTRGMAAKVKRLLNGEAQ